MSATKKRSVTEVSSEDDNTELSNERLSKENEELKGEIKMMKGEIEELKAKLADYEEEEESDDDEDDDQSVCDGSKWSKCYFELKQFKQQNGHCKVPQKHPTLGFWVNNTRKSYKSGKLSQDRIDKLEKLGFYWGKGYPEPATWDSRFEELQKHHATFGHCNIPLDPIPSLQTVLAKWVAEQRKQGKRLQKQKPSSMTLEQYKLLDDLNFKWKVAKARRS